MELHSDRYSPAQGWQSVDIFLSMLIADWGAPALLAGRRAIRRAHRKMILAWLIPLEALARRLLMIMAADLGKPVFVERKARSVRQPAGHGRSYLWSDDSAAWGVRFALTPRKSQRSKSRARTSRLIAPVVDPFPLAERIEALARVLADPAPYAARMARAMHKAPGVEAAFDLIFKPCRNGMRVNPLGEAIRDATIFAAPLVPRFADTS